jgi:hypothetical protein
LYLFASRDELELEQSAEERDPFHELDLSDAHLTSAITDHNRASWLFCLDKIL